MKKLWISFLLCLFAFSLPAQTESKDADLEKFKEKLNVYLDKYQNSGPFGEGNPMVQKPDTSKYRMPSGNITSYMTDPETGLMKEHKTGQIFDPETKLLYDPESGKIYDPEEEKYYDL